MSRREESTEIRCGDEAGSVRTSRFMEVFTGECGAPSTHGHSSTRRLGFYFTANRRFAECYGPIVLSAPLTLCCPFRVEGQSAETVIRRMPLPTEAKAELSAAFRGDDYNQYGLLEAAERFGLR